MRTDNEPFCCVKCGSPFALTGPRRGQRGASGLQSEQSKAKARFEDLFKK